MATGAKVQKGAKVECRRGRRYIRSAEQAHPSASGLGHVSGEDAITPIATGRQQQRAQPGEADGTKRFTLRRPRQTLSTPQAQQAQ